MKVILIKIDQYEKIPYEYFLTNTPSRVAKSNSLKNEEDKKRCLLAGYLIHKYAKLEDRDIYLTSYGKPMSNTGLYFNISHSSDYVCLAIDSKPIGVDIEHIEEKHVEVSPVVLTKNEIDYIKSNTVESFHIIWTIKESIMKLTGLGLNLNPRSIDVLPLLQGKSIDWNGQSVYSKSIKIDEYVLSVSSTDPIDKIETETVK